MKNQKYNFSGFTIIETVIVLNIFILILLFVYSSFVISYEVFNKGNDKLELVQNGRVFFDRLSRELRQNVEIVTPLPTTKNEIGFPPPNEIQFQDGHNDEGIQYLKYYLDSNIVKRQSIVYFFNDDPDLYVRWNAEDPYGNPPNLQILEEREIAEYITDLLFYGDNLINIELSLEKGDTKTYLFTSIWGRNTI